MSVFVLLVVGNGNGPRCAVCVNRPHVDDGWCTAEWTIRISMFVVCICVSGCTFAPILYIPCYDGLHTCANFLVSGCTLAPICYIFVYVGVQCRNCGFQTMFTLPASCMTLAAIARSESEAASLMVELERHQVIKSSCIFQVMETAVC